MSRRSMSRLWPAVLAAIVLGEQRHQGRQWKKPPPKAFRPRPNRYLQGFNRNHEAERRRRQLERGCLRSANGLVRP